MAEATLVQEDVFVEPKVYERPEIGQHTAKITFVEDLKMQKDKQTDKMVHRVKFTFLITDEQDSQGEPFELSRTMNVSLGEKAHLGQFLRQLGVDTTGRINLAELKDMDILANIVETKVGDKTYANIDSVALPRKLRAAVTRQVATPVVETV
jgi:hypothetical protein